MALPTETRILMVEDCEADAELTHYALQRGGINANVKQVVTEAAFRDALNDFQPQLVISDFSLPTFDGMTAFQIVRSLRPDLPFVFMSGSIGIERAENALALGASAYVSKGDYPCLLKVLHRVLPT